VKRMIGPEAGVWAMIDIEMAMVPSKSGAKT
jgi:hypothetical protein